MKTSLIIVQILVLYSSFRMDRGVKTYKEYYHTPAFAGKRPDPEALAAGKIIDSVFCPADPTQSYALYVPASGNGKKLPIIYFFDPHGDGALPLKKYKSLAETYGFILTGSNNSKNGNDWLTTEHIWHILYEDSKNRLRFNSERMYACGFSGGAKVAGYIALKFPGLKGVIANGAGLPDGTLPGDFNFSFTAIAGQGDMNMTDLITFSEDLDKSSTRHHFILFDGKHEWAPENSMDLAFAGLQLDAMQQGIIPKDEVYINRYFTKSKKNLDSFYRADLLVKAGQQCKLSISILEGLSEKEAGWFMEKLHSLQGNPDFIKQQAFYEDLLSREQHTKEEYIKHFQQEDTAYWNKTISDLKKKAGSKTEQAGMYSRLLAFLSLAFYSFSNHLINTNEISEAWHYVSLYKMADPANSEAWYFSAILHARENLGRETENDLLKAADCGFRDENRMIQQTEFRSLSPKINFSRIENRMRNPPNDK
jgi:hypothetical protein